MHRDYQSNSPIRFYWFEDRIEILNPGGLFGEVTPESFPNRNSYRNPVIAEALKAMGYVNRFGYGVQRAQHLLSVNGNSRQVRLWRSDIRGDRFPKGPMKTVAFFNNKGGVGKTSLVYHLAWMFSAHGTSVLAADLDPQANLTAMFLDEDRLFDMWSLKQQSTIYDALLPLIDATGDVEELHPERISEGLHLIPGNLALSPFEDMLSEDWPKCLDGKISAFCVLTAFYRILLSAAAQCAAEIVLIDVGPNLGAINRSALIAAGYVAVPLAPDLFSLQGLKNLGPSLRDWRQGWTKRKRELPARAKIDIPSGDMHPIGYIVMQHSTKGSRPVKAYQRWMDRIPSVYRECILEEKHTRNVPPVERDPQCLAQLKHYRSLMPMAMDARKPMFFLKPADGAIGAHVDAVARCYHDFRELASRIAERVAVEFAPAKR